MQQHVVASGVAVHVVDYLEVVQVEHQYGRMNVRVALHACQFLFHTADEVAPVRQAGQEIGRGGVAQLGFDHLALGDVGDIAVPKRAAVVQAMRARVALAPAFAEHTQLHPKLQVPTVMAQRRGGQ